MAYVKTNWEDYPSTATAIDADALNHMEEGIYNNDQALGGKLDNASPSFSGNMTGSGNVTVGGEVENGNGETLHGAYQSAENVLPIDTESGNPAVITDAFGGACKSLKLTLAPIQSGSGTPSPQNVRPISGLSELNVARIGKNLLNPSDVIKGYYDYVTMLIEAAGSEVYRGVKLYVAPGTYTISFSKSASVVRLIADGVINYNPASNVRTYTFTVTTKGYIAVSWRDPNNADWDDTAQVQLEVGSTATTYEPYNGESITRTYGQTVYGGSDDVTGDGAVSSWIIVDLGDLNWTNLYTDRFYSNELTPRKANSNAVCSCFAKNVAEVSTIDGLTADMTFAFQSTNDFQIIIRDTDYSDANAFKTAMAGMKLAYEVATPTSIPLTAQNITLLHGDNVLTTDADSIEASYSADIALYIAKKIAEGSQNNRSLSKGGSSDEEVKEEVKEEEIEIKEAEPLTKEVR